MKNLRRSILLLCALFLISAPSVAKHLEYDVALRDSILSNISGAKISDNRVNILRYGAKGDGVKDCRSAFVKAMREGRKSGCVHIRVPSGVYFMNGPLHLESNVCIELEEGAVLKFTPDPEKYPIVNSSWEGTYLHNYSPVIVFVEDCDYAGYCKRGIYVKTNPDRGGFVKNLFVNNCSFGEVEDLFYVTSKYAGEGLDSSHFSEIEVIFVDGLSCSKASQAALVLQGTKQKPISNVFFDNISVGEAKIGISFSDTRNVTVGDCHIGGSVDVPTQVSHKDNIFG